MSEGICIKLRIAVLSVLVAISTPACTSVKTDGTPAKVQDSAENSAADSKAAAASTSQQDIEKKVMDDFNALVKKGESLSGLIKYIDVNIKGVSAENADIMVIKLEELQKKNLPGIEARYGSQDIIKKLSEIYKPDLDESTVADETLRKLLLETKETGYRVETAEGFYFPIINYSLYKKYSSNVSADIREYIEIMSAESDKVPAKDAALMIGWDEVLRRAFRQEAFLGNYPGSEKVGDVKQLFKKYVSFTLYGLNNTPLFSYDTNTMDPEARKAYEAASQIDDSKLSSVIKNYLTEIEKNNYKLTNSVKKYRKSVEGTF